jgi:hypothetical protein
MLDMRYHVQDQQIVMATCYLCEDLSRLDSVSGPPMSGAIKARLSIPCTPLPLPNHPSRTLEAFVSFNALPEKAQRWVRLRTSPGGSHTKVWMRQAPLLKCCVAVQCDRHLCNVIYADASLIPSRFGQLADRRLECYTLIFGMFSDIVWPASRYW